MTLLRPPQSLTVHRNIYLTRSYGSSGINRGKISLLKKNDFFYPLISVNSIPFLLFESEGLKIISPVFCENVYVLWRTSSSPDLYCYACARFLHIFPSENEIPASKLKNYCKSVAEHKDVTKLLTVLASVMTSSKAEVMCLDSFTKFRSVWDEDKGKAVAVSVCFRFVFVFS